MSALVPSQYDMALHRLKDTLVHLWSCPQPMQQPRAMPVEDVSISASGWVSPSPTQVVTLDHLVPDSPVILGFPSSVMPGLYSCSDQSVDPPAVYSLYSTPGAITDLLCYVCFPCFHNQVDTSTRLLHHQGAMFEGQVAQQQSCATRVRWLADLVTSAASLRVQCQTDPWWQLQHGPRHQQVFELHDGKLDLSLFV
jgi:hypothetical protein